MAERIVRPTSGFRAFEAFAALFAVAVKSVEDDGIGLGRGADLIDFDRFAFELFVILKEAAQHEQAVRGHFSGFAVGVEFGILGGDGDDFVVFLARVDHRHEADGAGVNDGQRHDGFLAEDENVERVIIFGERLRNESVIGGIVDGGIENAIEADEAARFVEFILHARAERDLDDAVEFLRKFVARSDVVPGMDHKNLSLGMFILAGLGPVAQVGGKSYTS
jgi:hypothetical protein